MNHVLQTILILCFNSTKISIIIPRILFIIGAWKMLEKSGLKSWWALIPGIREYQLARCANREPEGRTYCVTNFIITILLVIINALSWDPDAYSKSLSGLLYAALIAAGFINLIHNIRIFQGFIQLYGVKKRWILLCIIDETRFIPTLVWGLSDNYQPQWKLQDIEEAMDRLATEGSASVMKDGLTVNIKDRSVREFFRKNMLLRDIHMAIPQGHLVLLLGGSGAGKTTYLNAVTGYEKANAEVLLNGKDMYKDYDKMMYEIGFVPQTDMMRYKDTVINTLMDTARLRLSPDISPKKTKEHIEEVMDIFGLKPLRNSKVEKLSGGQRKRLSVAMEYLSNPSLFILDEPDSGLDGVMAKELFHRLRKIADSGKIVIVITHTPDRVIDLFDDVIVLAKDSTRTGRLAFYGSIDEAREFFGCSTMEEIVKSINRVEEGGDGLADDYVLKYAEVANG